MPRYVYNCQNCLETFTKRHSMSEKLSDCVLCDTVNSLKRIPSSVLLSGKQDSRPLKTGEIVKSAIEGGKKDLQQEKERLKNNFFEIENE